MEVFNLIEECPFCKTKAPVGTLSTPKTQVKLCENCHTCWEVRIDQNGDLERLVRYRITRFKRDGTAVEEPVSKTNELVCPVCWGKLRRDMEIHSVVCDDPICHYVWRMPGISKKEEGIKIALAAHRQKVYEILARDEKIPDADVAELKRLKEEYEKFRRYDDTPI